MSYQQCDLIGEGGRGAQNKNAAARIHNTVKKCWTTRRQPEAFGRRVDVEATTTTRTALTEHALALHSLAVTTNRTKLYNTSDPQLSNQKRDQFGWASVGGTLDLTRKEEWQFSKKNSFSLSINCNIK